MDVEPGNFPSSFLSLLMYSMGDRMYLLKRIGSMYKGDFLLKWSLLALLPVEPILKSRLCKKVGLGYAKAHEEVSF